MQSGKRSFISKFNYYPFLFFGGGGGGGGGFLLGGTLGLEFFFFPGSLGGTILLGGF